MNKTMFSKAIMSMAVGVAGIFIGYCFYFDQKRRNDPDFKKKLRERRKAKSEAQKVSFKVPNMKDHEVVQKFFVHEIEMGEELLVEGNVEAGTEHLANAVAVCTQPHQLLEILQNTLPPQVFHLLLQRLPAIGQKNFLFQKLNPQITIGEEDNDYQKIY